MGGGDHLVEVAFPKSLLSEQADEHNLQELIGSEPVGHNHDEFSGLIIEYYLVNTESQFSISKLLTIATSGIFNAAPNVFFAPAQGLKLQTLQLK